MAPVMLLWTVVYVLQDAKGLPEGISLDDVIIAHALQVSPHAHASFHWARWVLTLSLMLAALGFPFIAQTFGGGRPLRVRVRMLDAVQPRFGDGTTMDSSRAVFLLRRTDEEYVFAVEPHIRAAAVIVPRSQAILTVLPDTAQ
jgi:hypothetical protein